MGTTMGQRSGEWQFDRAAKRIGGWLTGYGLLSLNISLFLLAATGLFLLNLYQDPRNIDVFARLRIWALLIIFHAVAVTILWIMSWALRASQQDSTKTPRSATPRSGPIPLAAAGQSTSRSRFSPTISTPVIVDEHEESEHFWRRRSTAIWRKQEPGKQEMWSWSTTDEAEITHTWPESEPHDAVHYGPTVDVSPFTTDDLEEVEGKVHVERDIELTTSAPEARDEAREPTDSVIDPLRFVNRQQDAGDESGSDAVLTRWLWVEAAAAAWLAQREDETDPEEDSVVIPPADNSPPEALS
jgi:hypothetical protein